MPAKKTHEKIMREAQAKINEEEWKILDSRRNDKNEIEVLVEHLLCGTQSWKSNRIDKMIRCGNAECIRIRTKGKKGPKKKSDEQIIQETKALLDLEKWDVLACRRNNNGVIQVLIKHLPCGTEGWKNKTISQIMICGNPECFLIKTRKTKEQILREAKALVDSDEWQILDFKRENGKILILVKHLPCGVERWKPKRFRDLTECGTYECVRKKTIATNRARFGFDSPAESPIIQEKICQTNLKRYGYRSIFQVPAFQEKIRLTNIREHGVTHVSQRRDVKLKKNQTNFSRYGHVNPSQREDIKDKKRQTLLRNFGVSSPLQHPKIFDRMRETTLSRHGVPYAFLKPGRRKSKIRKDSKPNLFFQELLSSNNLSFFRELSLRNEVLSKTYFYDFQVSQILIEINPTGTHNSTFGVFGKPPLSPNYHLQKSQTAQQNNFHCIHVFDWDDPQKIINLLLPKQQIYARQCEIKEVPKQEAIAFLNQYHLQNSTKNQKIFLGLYFQNQLVALATFGKPRLNPNYQYELIRLCFHPSYQITGGSEKLFNHFLIQYNPTSVISYCDIAKFSGAVYEKLGFILLRTSAPTAHWYKLKGELKGMHLRDTSLRMRGFDILVGRKLGLEPFGKGTSNEELMLRHGFVEVFDCGQQTWVYLNTNKGGDRP